MNDRLLYLPGALLTLNKEAQMIDMNQTFLEELGYERQEMIGRHIGYICNRRSQIFFHTYFYPNINVRASVKEVFVKFNHRNGQGVAFIFNARKLPNQDLFDLVMLPIKQRLEYEDELKQTRHQLEGVLKEKDAALDDLWAINREIQEKQRTLEIVNQDLVYISNTDNLTGLNNRRRLQEELDQLISRREDFSLIMLDIDYFKRINDSYGHPIGDEVLIKVGEILTGFSRPGQLVGRLGGEEFLMFLPGILKDQAIKIANKLCLLYENSQWPVIGRLTVSLGIATYRLEDTSSTIVKRADQALYYAKEKGRNRIYHYDDIESLSDKSQ